MKYLLTGGAGFIGRNLTRLLLNEGHSVKCIDNFENSTLSDVSEFMNGDIKKYELFVSDIIREPEILDGVIQTSDVVIHLAATVGVKNATNNPSGMLAANIVGMMHVIDSCLEHKKRLLVSSSSEVYGWSPKTPFAEDNEFIIPTPDKTRFSYALSKIVEEYYAMGFIIGDKLPCTIFRLFNSTGEGQNNNHNLVIPSLVNQALKGEDMVIYGDGTQTRCFCYVGETIQAIYKLSLTDAAIGEIYNIGTNIPTSILQVAEIIKEISGSRSEIKLLPYKQAFSEGYLDMQQRIPNLNKIQELLGWNAKKGIYEIIESFVLYEQMRRNH